MKPTHDQLQALAVQPSTRPPVREPRTHHPFDLGPEGAVIGVLAGADLIGPPVSLPTADGGHTAPVIHAGPAGARVDVASVTALIAGAAREHSEEQDDVRLGLAVITALVDQGILERGDSVYDPRRWLVKRSELGHEAGRVPERPLADRVGKAARVALELTGSR